MLCGRERCGRHMWVTSTCVFGGYVLGFAGSTRCGRNLMRSRLCLPSNPAPRHALTPLGFDDMVSHQNLTAAVYMSLIGRTPETLLGYKVGGALVAGA